MMNVKKLILILTVSLAISACTPSRHEMPITTSSEEARELFIQGRDYMENYESIKADSIFGLALELDPDFALAHLCQFYQAGVPKAKRLIGGVSQGESMMINAYDAFLSGKLELCDIFIDSLVGLHPHDKHSLVFAGLLYKDRNEEKAIEYFRRAIKLDKYYAAPYYSVALQQIRLGQYEQSVESFYKYFDLISGSGNAHLAYGNLFKRMGLEEEALDQYKRALLVEPSTIYAFINIIWLNIKMEDYGTAMENCNLLTNYSINSINNFESIALSNEQLAISMEAIISFIQEDFQSTIQFIDSCIQLNKDPVNYPTLMYIMNLKAWYAFQADNPELALQILREALDLSITSEYDTDIKNSRIMWHYGTISVIYGSMGNLFEAEKYLNEARMIMRVRDNSITDKNFMRLYEGIFESHCGNYDKAISILSLPADRTSVSNQYYLARAYDLAGNNEQAIKYYKLAKESTNPYYTGLFYNESKKRLKELSE